MSLKFRGPPILNHSRDAVRFIAYPEGSYRPNIVVCHVTRGALEYLSRDPKLGADRMLLVFDNHVQQIRDAARLLFETGAAEPLVTEETLKKGRPNTK